MNQLVSRASSKYRLTPRQLITQYNFLQRHVSSARITPENDCWDLPTVRLKKKKKRTGRGREKQPVNFLHSGWILAQPVRIIVLLTVQH